MHSQSYLSLAHSTTTITNPSLLPIPPPFTAHPCHCSCVCVCARLKGRHGTSGYTKKYYAHVVRRNSESVIFPYEDDDRCSWHLCLLLSSHTFCVSLFIATISKLEHVIYQCERRGNETRTSQNTRTLAQAHIELVSFYRYYLILATRDFPYAHTNTHAHGCKYTFGPGSSKNYQLLTFLLISRFFIHEFDYIKRNAAHTYMHAHTCASLLIVRFV